LVALGEFYLFAKIKQEMKTGECVVGGGAIRETVITLRWRGGGMGFCEAIGGVLQIGGERRGVGTRVLFRKENMSKKRKRKLVKKPREASL